MREDQLFTDFTDEERKEFDLMKIRCPQDVLRE